MKKHLNKIFFLLAISICSFEVSSEAIESEVSLLVHKTPTCGCCKIWVKHLEINGFSPSVKDHKSLQNIKEKFNISMLDTNYLFLNGEIVNDTYKINDIEINILFKKNITKNLMEINNKFYASSLNKTIKKYFYCFPKNCEI